MQTGLEADSGLLTLLYNHDLYKTTQLRVQVMTHSGNKIIPSCRGIRESSVPKI